MESQKLSQPKQHRVTLECGKRRMTINL